MAQRKGYKMTEEHKRRISEAHKGKSKSEETKRKMSKSKSRLFAEGKIKSWNKGKKGLQFHTEEWKRENSIRNKGTKRSEETKRKMSLKNKGKNNPMYGKKLSEESKQKMINKLKGRRILWKEKIGIANLGRIVSEETRKKLSEINKHKYKEGYINPMQGKKHSDEVKRKLKLLRKKRILPMRDTSIEVKIQSFLKELGIEYFTHQYMDIKHGYQCDILIPSMNLVIECDGNYWHKYPIGKDIDHIRTKELIEKGFKVLRLWEIEINSLDLDKFQEKLNETN